MDQDTSSQFIKTVNEDGAMLRLTGKSLYLRKLKLEDAEAVFAAIEESRKELDEFFVWSPLVREVRDTEEFIKSRRKLTGKSRELVLGVFSREDDSYLGNVGLHLVPASPHSTEVGYWVRTSATGKGVATSAAALVTIAAFDQFKFHRLVLRAAVDNPGSNKVALKLGMRLGGVQRHELQVTRGFLDLNYYTLLEDEYSSLREQIKSLVK